MPDAANAGLPAFMVVAVVVLLMPLLRFVSRQRRWSGPDRTYPNEAPVSNHCRKCLDNRGQQGITWTPSLWFDDAFPSARRTAFLAGLTRRWKRTVPALAYLDAPKLGKDRGFGLGGVSTQPSSKLDSAPVSTQ
jgi:hypothetical protein